jgi:hypothetical protein
MESRVASRPFANLNSASFALQTATPYRMSQYTGRLRGVYRCGAAMASAFRPAPCPLLIAERTIESTTIGLAARRQTHKSSTPPKPASAAWPAMSGMALSRWLRSCDLLGGSIARRMKSIDYDGYRFPPAIIQQAIWLYFRFTLSFRDV